MSTDQVKERPILFSAPMVRALLAGTKTQTRRALRDDTWLDPTNGVVRMCNVLPGVTGFEIVDCPYGQPGDRLWVREAFSGPWCMEAQDGLAAAPPSAWARSSRIWYWADGEPTHGDWTRPRPSIHMPRWASRITLEVTEVRVERLQDISEADAIAEGISTLRTPEWDKAHFTEWRAAFDEACAAGTKPPIGPLPSQSYRALWESINGPGSWDANPWVWCVSFKRIV